MTLVNSADTVHIICVYLVQVLVVNSFTRSLRRAFATHIHAIWKPCWRQECVLRMYVLLTDRQTDRQTNRQTGRQTDTQRKQADRQASRQVERHTKRLFFEGFISRLHLKINKYTHTFYLMGTMYSCYISLYLQESRHIFSSALMK